MNKHSHTNTATHDMGTLAEDARALMTATADVAGEKVGEARERLAAALDRAKKVVDNIRDRTVESAKATDKAVRKNPYKAIAIGVGAGLLIGFLAGRRNSSKGD